MVIDWVASCGRLRGRKEVGREARGEDKEMRTGTSMRFGIATAITGRRGIVATAVAMAIAILGVMPSGGGVAYAQAGKNQAEQIAGEAFVYGFPMVMNYAVFYKYFIDKSDPSYKAPLNQIWNAPNVFTYKDTAIVTPNSDTPYS